MYLSTSILPICDENGVESEFVQKFPKKYFNGLMFVMVLISVIVMSANAPAEEVILIAQASKHPHYLHQNQNLKSLI